MKKMLTVAGAALLALIGTGALAQGGVEEVTIQASRDVNANVVGRTSSGIPIRDVSLTYRVSLEGLDLTSDAGAAELEKRVNDVAYAACRELGRLYKNSTPSDAECTRAAVAKAMTRVHEVVAVARAEATD